MKKEIEIFDNEFINATEKALNELKSACQRAIEEDTSTTNTEEKISITKVKEEFFVGKDEKMTIRDKIELGVISLLTIGVWVIGLIAIINWIF